LIGTSHNRLLTLLVALPLAALTFVLYSQTLGFGFVNWDDDVYLFEQARVQQLSAENVLWFFTHAYYNAFIPLTMLSHMLDFQLWQSNPSGHHLTNILLHSLNTLWFFAVSLFVFSLLQARDGDGNERTLQPKSGTILLATICSTLLFAWHPLRVESVAWISDRKDLLCTFFLLPALLAYMKYALDTTLPKRGRLYLLSLVLFGCACLAKPIAATFPIVLIFLDSILLRPGDSLVRTLRDKIPFLIVATATAVVAATLVPDASTADALSILSPMQRVLLPFYNMVFYAVKNCLPTKLSPVYPTAGEHAMLAAAGAFAILTLGCFWSWMKGRKLPGLSWLVYCILLAPSVGIASVVVQTTADRYSYLPSTALALFAGGIVGQLYTYLTDAGSRRALVATAFVVLAFLAFLNFRQQKIWKNSERLWGATTEMYPNIALPYNNLGMALQARGALDEAIDAYTRALKLKPDYIEAHLNLGTAMFAKGRRTEAKRLFLQALELRPTQAEVLNNLGVLANAEGQALEAISWFQKSVAANPNYAQGYYNLGVLYKTMGNTEASADAMQKAAALGHRGAGEVLKSRQTDQPHP